MPSRAHCLTVDRARCLRPTISRPAAPGLWTGPFPQKTPFHLELADLLVEPGDGGGVPILALVLVPVKDAVENAGRSFHQRLLPSLD